MNWPVVHLRSTRHPWMARCGLWPPLRLLTDDWNGYTCGACLIPYRPGPLDPRRSKHPPELSSEERAKRADRRYRGVLDGGVRT